MKALALAALIGLFLTGCVYAPVNVGGHNTFALQCDSNGVVSQ
jgi:hypothetical protein